MSRVNRIFEIDQQPWWSRVNTVACVNADYSNLENRNKEKDMSLFFSYGSMISPQSAAYKQRSEFAFRKGLFFENNLSFSDYYLGLYKLEGYELAFSKDSGNGTAFATIVRGEIGSYVLLGCHAVPNKLLARGGNLLVAEGTLNHDYYNPANHYILLPLTEKVTNIDNGHVLDPFNGYIFVASSAYTKHGLPAADDYKKTITTDLLNLQAAGHAVPDTYIQKIANAK